MRGQDITVLVMCLLMLGAFLFLRIQGRKEQQAPDRRLDDGAGSGEGE